MNWYFLLAVIMSFLGPLSYYALAPNISISRFIDGMIVTALVSLVTLHILPESIEHSALITLVAVILGLIGPVFFSQFTKRNQCEIQKPFVIISVFGFIAHNMLDGAALVIHPTAHSSTPFLALAVGLHRFVEGIAVYKTVSKSFGLISAVCALFGLSVAMAAGFFFSEQIFTTMDENILHFLQSLACGLIFHVLLHPHHLKDVVSDVRSSNSLVKIQSAGALTGLILALLAYLYWPAHTHGSHSHQNWVSHHEHSTGE